MHLHSTACSAAAAASVTGNCCSFPNTILCTLSLPTSLFAYLFLRLLNPSHPAGRGHCFVESVVYVQKKAMIARGKYLPVIS